MMSYFLYIRLKIIIDYHIRQAEYSGMIFFEKTFYFLLAETADNCYNQIGGIYGEINIS